MSSKGGRLWQRTRDREVITNLLHGKLAQATFHPAGGESGQIRLFQDAGRLVSECEATVLTPGRATVWTRAGRHVEVDLNVVAPHGESGRFVVEPLEVRISAVDRTMDRVNVINDSVHASTFAISRPAVTIDAAGVHLGVAGRLIVKEIEKQMAREFPGFRIFELEDPARPPETRFLAGTAGHSILIPDTSDLHSYEPMSEEFADLPAMLKPKGLWDSTLHRYHNERIGSVLTVPLLYETPGAVHVFAYMHLACNAPNALNFAVLCRWREIAFDIQERLARASPVQVKDRQRVMDISESGAKLRLNNSDLVRYVPEQSRMSFDLVFRLQAPVRVNTYVVYVRPDDDHLVAGVHFRGFGFSEAPVDLRERLRTYIRMIHS